MGGADLVQVAIPEVWVTASVLPFHSGCATNHAMMQSRHMLAATVVALTSCSATRDPEFPPPPGASEVASKLPPIRIPIPKSPVDLRTAVLTLPDDALAGMSQDGRRNYLAHPAGDYDAANRRIHLYCDNPHVGIDSKSMLFLRLFEDESGRTIAASHAARPFADSSVSPSTRFTKVYRLEHHQWRDITDTAFSSPIPGNSWFHFNNKGEKVPFGPYVVENRFDGRGTFYNFGKKVRTMAWRDGTFRVVP